MRVSPFRRTIVAAFIIAVATIGCSRQRAVTATPPPANWEYCWWTLLLTPTPPDSVAMRFARAFGSTGQLNATFSFLGDTAWAHAGPTPLANSPGVTYWSRVVAYRQQDTTRYRSYVAVSKTVLDSSGHIDGPGALALCGPSVRAAGLTGWRPSRDPNYQDSVSVWSRFR